MTTQSPEAAAAQMGERASAEAAAAASDGMEEVQKPSSKEFDPAADNSCAVASTAADFSQEVPPMEETATVEAEAEASVEAPAPAPASAPALASAAGAPGGAAEKAAATLTECERRKCFLQKVLRRIDTLRAEQSAGVALQPDHLEVCALCDHMTIHVAGSDRALIS